MYVHVFNAVVEVPCDSVCYQFLKKDMSRHSVESFFKVNKAGIHVFAILKAISVKEVIKDDKGV